jgi:D-alanine-D-alanine ligase
MKDLLSLIKANGYENINQIEVFVLAPSVESEDENIEYYYDFTQSIAEYTNVFRNLNITWHWKQVNMSMYPLVIDEIQTIHQTQNTLPVVLNLCDGDEINGTPGISVVKMLAEKNIVYTGADEFFYNITTSKIPMKKAFDDYGVPTPAWSSLSTNTMEYDKLFQELGNPIIVKPAVSAGSMGVGVKNVVEGPSQLQTLLNELAEGYRGWNLTAAGFIAESFVNGPEYTTLIVGSYDDPENAMVFPPIERVFHESLPEKEKFLSFERLWEIYETETPMPHGEHFYEYQPAAQQYAEAIKKVSWDAFVSNKGKGYTRVDLRMDSVSKKIYVLEVNAQCGLSEDENYTSIGAILKFAQTSFTSLVEMILTDALIRHNRLKNLLQKKDNPVNA